MAENIGGANFLLGVDASGWFRGLGKIMGSAKQLNQTLKQTAAGVSQSSGKMANGVAQAASSMAQSNGNMASAAAQAAAGVTQANGTIAAGAAQTAAAVTQANNNINQANNNMAGNAARAARTLKLQQDKLINTINLKGRQAGKSPSQFYEEELVRLGVPNPQVVAPGLAALKKQEQGMQGNARSAKQMSQAMRLLPAQITDIVVSLASGQPAYMVALQQGGQLKDMFGSVGAAAKALATGLKASFAALLNPVVLAIAGVATALVGLYQIFRQAGTETSAMANALVASGNYAGKTTSQMIEMAKSISGVVGTQRQASEALTGLASTGQISGRMFEKLGTSVVNWSKATGKSMDEVIKDFVALGKDPAEASLKLNESMNYLTGSVYKQIRALEDQGKVLQAGELAQSAYSTAMDARTKKMEANLGTIEWGWKKIGEAAKKAWDWMLGIGREKSIDEQISMQESALKNLEGQRETEALQGHGTKAIDDAIVAQAMLIQQLKERKKATEDAAAAEGKAAAKNKQDVLDEQFKEHWLTKHGTARQKAQMEINRLQKEYNRELTKTEKAKITQELLDKEKKPPKVKDSTATKMLQELREAERVIDREIEQRQELNVHAEKLVEFEQTISNIAAKRYKDRTDPDKSLFAYQDAIRAQLKRNSAKEKERDLVLEIEKAMQRQNERDIESAHKLLALRQELLAEQETRDEGYSAQLGTAMSDRAEDEFKEQLKTFKEFDKMRAKLRRDTPVSELGTKEYLRQLEEINTAMEVAIERQEQYNQGRAAQRTSGEFGASKALENYMDDARNMSEQVESAWTNAFSGIEDTMIDFAKTGKLSFKGLADSLIADLTRIFMKAMLLKVVEGMLGNYNSTGLDSLIAGQSAKHGAFTGSGFGSQNDFMPQAAGTNYVPYDGFKASLHRGEAVVPAKYNPAAGGMSAKRQQSEQPIVQYITVQGGGGGQSAPERDQMRRMFRDGVRSGLAEARGRNSPLL